MIIKASTTLRNDFTSIDNLANSTQEPIYITKNGEGSGVYMNLEAFEKREQILNLREKLLKADEQRVNGEGFSIDEVRNELKEQLNGL